MATKTIETYSQGDLITDTNNKVYEFYSEEDSKLKLKLLDIKIDFPVKTFPNSDLFTKVEFNNVNGCQHCEGLSSNLDECKKCNTFRHSDCKHDCKLEKKDFSEYLSKFKPITESSSKDSSVNGAPFTKDGLEVENLNSAKLISLGKIKPGHQHRFELNEFHKEKLKKNILLRGLLVPIIVLLKIIDGNEIYVIEDGHHRYSAIKELGWKTIRAIVVIETKNEFEEKLDAYKSNSYHLAYSDVEKAAAIADIYNDAKLIDPEITKRKFASDIVEEPFSTVNDYLNIAGLHYNIHTLMNDPDTPLAKSTAIIYKKLSMEDQDIFFEYFSNNRDRGELRQNINLWLESSDDQKEIIKEKKNWNWLEDELEKSNYEKYSSIIDEIDSKYPVNIYDVDRSPFLIEFIDNLIELIILQFEEYFSISKNSSYIKEFKKDKDLKNLWKVLDEKMNEVYLTNITVGITQSFENKLSQDEIDRYIDEAKEKLKVKGSLDLDEFISEILESQIEENEVLEVEEIPEDDLTYVCDTCGWTIATMLRSQHTCKKGKIPKDDDLKSKVDSVEISDKDIEDRKSYGDLFSKSLREIETIDKIIMSDDLKTTDRQQNLYSALVKSIKDLWNPHQINGIQYETADLKILEEIYLAQFSAYRRYEALSNLDTADPIEEEIKTSNPFKKGDKVQYKEGKEKGFITRIANEAVVDVKFDHFDKPKAANVNHLELSPPSHKLLDKCIRRIGDAKIADFIFSPDGRHTIEYVSGPGEYTNWTDYEIVNDEDITICASCKENFDKSYSQIDNYCSNLCFEKINGPIKKGDHVKFQQWIGLVKHIDNNTIHVDFPTQSITMEAKKYIRFKAEEDEFDTEYDKRVLKLNSIAFCNYQENLIKAEKLDQAKQQLTWFKQYLEETQ